MAIRRTVSRRQEKRPIKETRVLIQEELPEAPQPLRAAPTEPAKRTAFEEFGGVHGLICAAQMLCNAHLLTLVLCRQMHCGEYQDLYYAAIGILGCIGGFGTADTTDALGMGGLGRAAMRLQLLLIAVSAWDSKDLECQCAMPYPSSDRLMYMGMKQYTVVVSLFSTVFHLLIPSFEVTPTPSSSPSP